MYSQYLAYAVKHGLWKSATENPGAPLNDRYKGFVILLLADNGRRLANHAV